MKIMCKNMTNALKANKLLYNVGIYSKVEKSTESLNVKGCVYVIDVKDKDFEQAIKIMREGKVVLHKNEQNYYGDELF